MGKASTNKKVARAAGTGGGRTNRGRTPWTYYGVLLLVVVLGVVAAWTSRNHRLASLSAADSTNPPTLNATGYSAAFAVDICGKLQPSIGTPKKNPVGITTHGDGIIYISPTKNSATGKHATLGLFASSVGMKLNAAEIQLPGQKLYVDGASCEGKPGHVYVQRFSYPLDKTGVLETTEANNIHLDNAAMYTIAFLPTSKKNSIPTPSQSVISALQSLQAAASAATSTTTAGSGLSGTTSSTTAGSATTKAPSSNSTATTVAKSATTAGGSATTAGTTATTAAKS